MFNKTSHIIQLILYCISDLNTPVFLKFFSEGNKKNANETIIEVVLLTLK